MKKSFIIFFLFLFKLNYSQEIENKALTSSLNIQSKNFEEIEAFLIKTNTYKTLEYTKENKKFLDSINQTKFTTLAQLYQKINDYDIQVNKTISKQEDQNKIEDYYKIHFEKVDSLYSIFLKQKELIKPTEKQSSSEQNSSEQKIFSNNQNNENITLEETPPSHESCKDTPTDKNCALHFISKRVMMSYAHPYYRKINAPKLRILTVFTINKSGIIEGAQIVTSSNYFEYDMEAIKVFLYLSKLSFIPATQYGKPVNSSYTLPINVAIIEE